jgi:hypothetical protein
MVQRPDPFSSSLCWQWLGALITGLATLRPPLEGVPKVLIPC